MQRQSHTFFSVSTSLRKAAIFLKTGCAIVAITTSAHAQSGVAPKPTGEIGEPAQPASSVPTKSALPSSLIYYIHLQNYLQPEWSQKKIAEPLVELAQRENLDNNERFFWAQLNFMSFKAQEAYDLFSEFADRDDWYGWMARQRLAIMDVRAFENFDRLKRNVEKERKEFIFRPEFASIPGFGERSLCAHWASEGKHKRAAVYAAKTVSSTPRDAAYGPLYAVLSCYPSFEETGRKDEAFKLAQAISSDLKETLSERYKIADQHSSYDPDLFENKVEDSWYGRSLIAPYNYQSYKIEQMIKQFDDFLACKRDGQEHACNSKG